MNGNRLQALKSDILLLTTALIWGFAFVAQKKGMESCEPFMFNGIRFALGATVLLPFLKKNSPEKLPSRELIFSLVTGVALFTAASLQQIGIKFTTAGNAGFITGLYVVFVPIIGLFLKQKAGILIWISSILATLGLYAISSQGKFEILKGDFIVLIGALIWAIHVQLVGRTGRKTGAIRLAVIQFLVCSFLSFFFSIFLETNSFTGIIQAGYPILYGGLLSVGIAYTLQIVAQKNALPGHAAILLSMESLFAVLGGVLLLTETVSFRSAVGFLLMLTAMFLAQINQIRNNR
ncbi:MAG: DMT family transporter [Candidatus Cloacimonetes bacterium]|nr:DMT family transporter [Candidatus Cloacimonadota bacterium]